MQWVTLNRPERRNAIDPTMTHELADHFAGLQDDTSIRAVVLQGAGKGFCAGLDIKASLAGELDRAGRDRLSEIVVGIATCPQVVVALVHGAACGGGFAMSWPPTSESSVRQRPDERRGSDHGRIGVRARPQLLPPALLGLATATELMLTGRFLDAPAGTRRSG